MSKLELETVLDAVCPRAERADAKAFESCYEAIRRTGCPPAQILALYLIDDLYSEGSSSQANLERIRVSLHAAQDDLVEVGRRLNSLELGHSG